VTNRRPAEMCRPESNTLTRYTERHWRLLPARASLSASAPAAGDGARTPERRCVVGPEPAGRHPKPRIHPIGRRQCTATGTRETARARSHKPVPLAASTPPRPSARAGLCRATGPLRASGTLLRDRTPPRERGSAARPDPSARAGLCCATGPFRASGTLLRARTLPRERDSAACPRCWPSRAGAACDAATDPPYGQKASFALTFRALADRVQLPPCGGG
jgi:hypothetical protein